MAKRYRAFISYSHKDASAAARLHRALENYRLPLGVAADLTNSSTRRLGRFFRDADEMPASTDIGATVRGALAESESLIVVCSPTSAKSQWVNAEIEHFLEAHPGDRVFAVIVDGNPDSSDPNSDCFPLALRRQNNASGMPIEPVGIDVRKEPMARVCARLAAGILNIDFDDLWKRDRRRFVQRAAFISSAAALSVGVLAWFGITAFDQRQQALLAQSDFLAAQAELLELRGDNAGAMSFALEALPRPHGLWERPLSERAEQALAESLQHNRLSAILRGSQAMDRSVLSSDGRFVATLGAGGDVRVWNMRNGAFLRSLVAHTRDMEAAEFSRDGRLLVTAADDGVLGIWRTADWSLQCRAPEHEEPIKGVALSADGSLAVTASNDHTARIVRTRDCAVLHVLRGHTSRLNFVTFSPDQRLAMTTSNDETTRLWDIASGAERRVLRGHASRIISAAFSPDGRTIASASWDGTARLWSTASGRAIAVMQHDGPVNDVQFSPDGALVATASFDRTARLWDARTGHELRALRAHEGRVRHVRFAPDERLLTVSDDGLARLWNASTGDLIDQLGGHDGPVLYGDFTETGDQAVTVGRDGTARLWDTRASRDSVILRANNVPLSVARFSPDGRFVATASRDSSVRVWNAQTGQPLDFILRHRRPVEDVAFSRDGRWIASASEDGAAQIARIDARGTLKRAPPPAKAGAKSGSKRAAAPKKPAATLSKLDAIVGALRSAKGATIPDLMELTGWQSHSIRGAIAGALKKRRGLNVISTVRDGERYYRVGGGA